MIASTLDTAEIVTSTPESAARALLRHVDRAALDQLLAAFVQAVALPAAVLSPTGGVVEGEVFPCPACANEAADSIRETLIQQSGTSGWIHCRHGQASMVLHVTTRTGEQLAVISVGPVAVSDSDVDVLRRALRAQGESEKVIAARMQRVHRVTADRVESAARLLAQTLDTVVREAAIASENADLVATQLQANRELTVLYSVARALGSGIELQAILQRLVDAVGEMLGSEVVLVGLIEDDQLVTVASRGLLTYEARNGRLKVGEGLAGRVASTGEPLWCRDMQEDPRQVLTAINSRENLHAFAGVPLTLQGITVGVLAVYRRVVHAFPESELQLLAHIADLAAVAMERARLYEQERHATGELRSLHTRIESQHQALERATTVHDQLTHMVLQDAGLGAIVNSLAGALGAPVAVVDQFRHFVAGSLTDLANGSGYGAFWTSPVARDDAEVRRWFDAVRESHRPVAVPAFPALGFHHAQIVAPVIVGRDVLGYLSVVECNRSFEEPDLLAISHATTVIALEMMKQRTRAEVERRLRGELLEELVRGQFSDPDAVQRRAAYLGYNLATPYALVFMVTGTSPGQSASIPTARPRELSPLLADVIEDLTGRRGTGSMVLPESEGVFIAVPLQEGTIAEAREAVEALRKDASRRGIEHITAGIGRLCHSPADFSISAVEARRAVALSAALGASDRIIVFEDLGVYRILADLPRPSDALRFAEDLLSPLEAYDVSHGTNLVATLESYFAANSVLQHTAAAMSVHVNTLSYRLQRIRELTGVDMSDSDARLGLHLAVKIRQAVRLTAS